jgi:hypothetical protein
MSAQEPDASNRDAAAPSADPDQLVLLTTARTEFEGRTMTAALEAQGIVARVFAASANMMQWEGGYTDPIKVMVRRADLARAAAALKQTKQDSVDLDWSEVDVGQPEPGTVLPMPGATRLRTGTALRHVRRIGFILIFAGMLAGFMAPTAVIPILIVAVTLIIAGWSESSQNRNATRSTDSR